MKNLKKILVKSRKTRRLIPRLQKQNTNINVASGKKVLISFKIQYILN